MGGGGGGVVSARKPIKDNWGPEGSLGVWFWGGSRLPWRTGPAEPEGVQKYLGALIQTSKWQGS